MRGTIAKVAGSGEFNGQAAKYSFVAASVVGLMLLMLWFYLRPEAQIHAVQRSSRDVVVSWRCSAGHVFSRRGSYLQADCPVTGCGKKANILVTYSCPRHGAIVAEVKIVQIPGGGERVSAVSFSPRLWDHVDDRIVCPKCGSLLTPQKENPFPRSDARVPSP